jgi:hypothetical protein
MSIVYPPFPWSRLSLVYIEWRLQPDVFGIGLFLFNQKEVMMSRTQRLYELQQVELEAESVARRLREITTQLGESADLQRARNIVTQAEGRLNKQRAQMKGLAYPRRSKPTKAVSIAGG